MSVTRYPARAGIMLSCVLIMSAASPPAVAAGDWPGGGRPGPEVGVFAAGVISTDLAERDLSVAASGDWLAYTIMGGRQGVTVLMHRQDGVGDEDIFVCRREGSGYRPAVPVPCMSVAA